MRAFRARRALLPAGTFLGALALHFLWRGLFPERAAGQDRWVSVEDPGAGSWLRTYRETGALWLGYSYGVSLGFAAAALRAYREERACGARTLAVGGVTFSGFVAVAGCWLLGCCGSPMLGVYLGLFGASFLPWAGPLVAAFSTASVLGAWWWMRRRRPSPGTSGPPDAACCGSSRPDASAPTRA